MYVFDNTVRAEDGTKLGTFSNHGAAYTAMIREANPNWKPAYHVDKPEDLAEEAVMSGRIRDLQMSGMQV